MTDSVDGRFSEAPYPELFSRAETLRKDREAFQDRVAAGEFDLDDVFAYAEEDPAVATMKVLGVVEAIPGFLKVQTRRAFGDLGISEAAHIDGVSASQRAGLADALERHRR